ncbi:hypothetical protein CDAR_618561 [Caerostris darwini]|uniref:Uncharacterized protein n=1 Tax=Caerostris darwini TaxID=1538125 RepID=A0AAV4SS61_9ARAC|nr:hypothetical protein CDAR_618561 [Caerostris darwini]
MTQGGGPEQEGDFWLREGRRSGLEPAFFVDDILHPRFSCVSNILALRNVLSLDIVNGKELIHLGFIVDLKNGPNQVVFHSTFGARHQI